MSKSSSFSQQFRTEFFTLLHLYVDYWANNDRAQTAREKCDGVAFSILCLLDGANWNFPGVDLVVRADEDDGFEDVIINETSLHDDFHSTKPKGVSKYAQEKTKS